MVDDLTLQLIKRIVIQTLTERRATVSGVVGRLDTDGHPHVFVKSLDTSQTDYDRVWVRTAQGPRECRYQNTPPTAGTLVKIAFDDTEDDWYIVGPDYVERRLRGLNQTPFGVATHAFNHEITFDWFGTLTNQALADPLFLPANQIADLCVQPTSDPYGLVIQKGWYEMGQQLIYIPKTSVADMSAQKPAAGEARMIAIDLDDTGAIVTVTGSAFTKAGLTHTQLGQNAPALNPLRLRLADVLLDGDESRINWQHIIMRARIPHLVSATSGGSSSADHTLIIPPTNTTAGQTTITFDRATVLNWRSSYDLVELVTVAQMATTTNGLTLRVRVYDNAANLVLNQNYFNGAFGINGSQNTTRSLPKSVFGVKLRNIDTIGHGHTEGYATNGTLTNKTAVTWSYAGQGFGRIEITNNQGGAFDPSTYYYVKGYVKP